LTLKDRLVELLDDADASALVILANSASEPDLAPFVGAAHIGQCFLLASASGETRLGYFTEMERDEAASTGLELLGPTEIDLESLRALGLSSGAFLADAVGRSASIMGIEPGGLAVAGTAAAGDTLEFSARLSESGWSLLSGSEIGRLLRKSKTPAQVAEIRRVASYVCSAFRQVAQLLASADVSGSGELSTDGTPLTAGRLRNEIATVFANAGLDQPHGNIVALGADGGVPHTAGEDGRVLQAGQSLVVDVYPKGDLFADCTRTLCVGVVPEELERAHALAVESLLAAHEEARAGVSGWSLQEAVCARLARAGFATPIDSPGATKGYVHNLGHGVGFALHEYPSFRAGAGDAGQLEEGDVFTLEPGLYDPDPARGYGVRVEDTVALSSSGLENLTPLPYSLDPSLW